jgi:hypothetical protein
LVSAAKLLLKDGLIEFINLEDENKEVQYGLLGVFKRKITLPKALLATGLWRKAHDNPLVSLIGSDVTKGDH